MKFRLLAGAHIQGDGPVDPATGRPTDKVYQRGDIVESNRDLAADVKKGGFNAYDKAGSLISAKFERLPDWATNDPHLAAAMQPFSVPPGYKLVPIDDAAHDKPAKAVAASIERVGPPAEPRSVSVSELNAMSMKDLQALAADKGIDLKGVNGREATVRVLAARLGSPQDAAGAR